MVKKQKQTYHSFIEDGQKYLQCKRCYEHVKVDTDAVAVTCSHCVAIYMMVKYPDTLPKTQKKSSGRPAGWHWMNEFVDKDGTVYHKGKEQPDLKGTLKPTKVKKRKKKKKLSADEKLQKRITDWNKRKKLRKQTKGKKKK